MADETMTLTEDQIITTRVRGQSVSASTMAVDIDAQDADGTDLFDGGQDADGTDAADADGTDAADADGTDAADADGTDAADADGTDSRG